MDSQFSDAVNPETILRRYRSGDLRTVGQFTFEPSVDDAIPGGAQRIVAVKVNPATQSTGQLPDDNNDPAADLVSADFGQFTEQISIEVDAGTLVGKLYTVTLEDNVTAFDNVGGTSIFDVIYAPGADGYDDVIATLNATNFVGAATKAETGLVAERANDIASAGVVDVVSSAGGDTTQSVTIYGLLAGAAVSAKVALNGTTNVQSVQTFDKVVGVLLDAAAVGTVTVSNFPVTTTLFTLAPAALTGGLVVTTNTPSASVLIVSIDVDTAEDVVVVGTDSNGTEVLERFDMSAGATTPVVGVVAFASITFIGLGDVAGARTVTITNNPFNTSHSVFTTVQRVVDRLNSLAGFTANAQVSNATTFLMVDADYHVAPTRPPVSLLTPAKDFFADLFFFIKKMNEESEHINATRATGGSLPPKNTTAPVFLTGGIEGIPTITEYQTAFNLLKKRRVNIIVPLTSDAAVHALLASHLVERAGKLRSEANGYVGLGKTDDTGETKTLIKSRIQSLGTRHISAIAEEPQRFDPDTGVATFFPPYVYAAIAAGMQAGSPVGTPLTRKRPFVTDTRNDSSWNVNDDGEELIDAGLMMSERIDGIGVRWVRSITTHLADDNVVFSEMSANESANTAVFELRRQLDLRIGNRALGGTVASIKGLVFDTLERLVTDEIIVAFRSVNVEQVNDVFPVSVEIAPVLPINFIPVTVHLVAVRAAA